LLLASAMLASGTPALAQDPVRPNYKNVENKSAAPAGRQLYRSVDEKGRVVYSDAPREAGQKAATMNNSVNVSSPEARRQMQIDSQNREREEQADRMAQMRRAQTVRQQEYEEAARKARDEERQNPEYAPRPIRVVR
jgi:hypothetical protein